jgi:plasmid stability protein
LTARHVAYNAIIDFTEVLPVASITIRNLDEQTKSRLRARAAHNKRSMEREARHILRVSLAEDRTIPGNLAEAIRRRFEPLGGVDLPLTPRGPLLDLSKLDG